MSPEEVNPGQVSSKGRHGKSVILAIVLSLVLTGCSALAKAPTPPSVLLPTRPAATQQSTADPALTAAPTLDLASGIPTITPFRETVAPPSSSASPKPASTSPAGEPAISPSVAATPTPASTLPAPSLTSLASPGIEVKDNRLSLPLLVDSRHGRLYALEQAGAGGQQRIAVFASSDGRRLATYENGGLLALDAVGDRIFVDRGSAGLAVLEGSTGKTLNTFAVPGSEEQREGAAAPQFDPATGQVLVFRGHTVYALDGTTGQVTRTVDFDLRPEDNCREPHDAQLPIARSFYDQASRLLYVDFVAYSCIPWIGYTNVAHDWAAGTEIGRQGGYPYVGSAANGWFYAESWHRFGIGTIWTEHNGRPGPTSTGWSSGSAFQLDTRRGQVVQSAEGSLRIFDADELSLRLVVPQPVGGELAGFDEVTDQLYFVQGDTVRGWPVEKLPTEKTAPIEVASPPGWPVHLLASSRQWSADKDLLRADSGIVFGVWAPPLQEAACHVFGQTGGLLLMSKDGGRRWQQPGAGLPAACGLISALAVSPDYGQDGTVLVGVKGNGIFGSTDGGSSWQPAGAGLPQMGVLAIAFSPGFAADRTAFAVVQESSLERSVDGGASWQTLGTAMPRSLALSPEFDRDGTVMLYSLRNGVGLLQGSHDRGDHWRDLEDPLPGDGALRMLSLAPTFARWQVMFALDSAGDLYRSVDAGKSWQLVLKTGRADAERNQIAYGPDEEQRAVFLLVGGAEYRGENRVTWGNLFRSGDGGQSWTAVEPGVGIVPTALAISPDFAEDGLILVGTADGRVLSLRDAEP